MLVASTDAYALKPAAHAKLTEQTCKANGLPDTFCIRVATEDFNVDGREWEDLEAHAQISAGETACSAADRTVEYVRRRGEDLRIALDAIASGARDEHVVGDAGHALGRLLHAVQDHCAHHGMPNPQHAWFSMSDFCEDTELSPDVQDDAHACARRETDAILRGVAKAVNERGIARTLGTYSCPDDPLGNERSGPPAVCQGRFLPSLFEACDFLETAEDWDGIDRQWNSDVVTESLRGAFAAGLDGGAPPAAVCAGDERVLSAAVSRRIMDVSGGPPLCNRLQLFCLGKLDADVHPFADELPDDAIDDDDVGGCAATGRPPLWLALVLAPLVVVRRRSRTRA